MELADDPRADGSGLARMEQLVRRPLEDGLGLQRGVERLDDPFSTRPSALDDRGHMRLLVR